MKEMVGTGGLPREMENRLTGRLLKRTRANHWRRPMFAIERTQEGGALQKYSLTDAVDLVRSKNSSPDGDWRGASDRMSSREEKSAGAQRAEQREKQRLRSRDEDEGRKGAKARGSGARAGTPTDRAAAAAAAGGAVW
ncbi:hypothetical protein Mp_5g21310 [Marchantia polymorpha subsp. ruderalis]|uniref:Uncharacterized protein n=2 Tax=Marchantia polymorpha TaxID=3197 RepID=A0AAF6BKQ5_MARPO|nr:hypothetical protein MARPO_0058s0113 [Marchantia polymorpha]BBN12589.1 hypothetical protein Mp_5g21310 [Marchantia polymorpha subsp. ruderalis]|eukprot:PTQ37350.1 hypothetical protein MARPO_0058s0113 [Marchantia polymorpha]